MTRRSGTNFKSETKDIGYKLKRNSHRNYKRDADRAVNFRRKPQQPKAEGFG